MKNILTLSLCVLLAISGYAQQQHTAFYKNGRKAIEGKWTYINPLTTVVSELTNTFRSMEKYGVHDLPDELRYGIRQPGLSFAFEGPVKVWYPDGQLWRKAFYKNASLNGEFECFYPSGKIYCKGRYVNGMEDGGWKYYQPDGKISMKTHYKAYTQQQLDQKMISALETNGTINNLQKWPSDRRLSTIVQSIYSHFPLHRLANGTSISGKQVFYSREGIKETELNFLDGTRQGSWIRFDEGVKLAEAVFNKDSLVALYDRNGKNQLANASFNTSEDVNALYRNSREQADFERRNVRPVLRTGFTDMGDMGWGDPLVLENAVVSPGLIEAPLPDAGLIEAPLPDAVFKYLAEMPKFPGDLNAWLKKHLAYPTVEKKAGIEERIILQFIVRKDGRAEAGKILRGGNDAFKQEALRLVKIMPIWKPGKNNGTPVDVYYAIPVVFKKD